MRAILLVREGDVHLTGLSKKYRDILLYLIFGALTTLENIVTYAALTRLLGMGEIGSNDWAWVRPVLFAYVTNKLWVFENRDFGARHLAREFGSFVAARLFSGALDMGIMWLFVTRLACPDLLVKTASNVVVIVLNYLFSKLIIFKKK